MKHTVSLLCILFSICSCYAQDQLGAIQDNYAPVNSAFINPSSIVDSKTWLDINIIGLGAYARNNSIYAPNTYVFSPSTYPDFIAINPQKNGYGYVTANVLGPSFTLNIKDHAIGFHMAARGYGFIKRIPDATGTVIDEFKEARIPDGNYFAEDIRVKSLVWEEYGITYGKIIYKRQKTMVQAAITANRLLGANAAGFHLDQGELEVVNQEGNLINLEGKYWYNEPARSAGKGFSGNVGFTYKKMKKDISNYVPHSVYGSCVVADYQYKIGVSLVDVGAIQFKQNALFNSFNENTNIDSLDDLADASEEALAFSEGNQFTAWLPSALSVQYDHNLNLGFYFNAIATQRLSFPSWFGTERASLYSAGFRYERKGFTVALPFSVHEYEYTQLGLSLRIWSLMIGTDNVMPFLRRQDIYAADVFLYFKWPIFKHPACRHVKNRERKNRGVTEKYLCPVW